MVEGGSSSAGIVCKQQSPSPPNTMVQFLDAILVLSNYLQVLMFWLGYRRQFYYEILGDTKEERERAELANQKHLNEFFI